MLAVRALEDGAGARPEKRGAILTSFGRLSVLEAEVLRGLAAKDVAGFTHFPSFVGRDKVQVHVSVELANVLGRAVLYAPGRFRLRVGSRVGVPPSASTAAPTTLRPGAAVAATLVFVVPRPRGRSGLRLEVRDGVRPLLIDLQAALAPTTAPEQEDHEH